MISAFAIAALGVLFGIAAIDSREGRERAHYSAVESVLCRPGSCDIARSAEEPAA